MAGSVLPSGGQIFTTMPDILFIPEFVFGGLVWTLVASTRVTEANPLGWVMFVSIFCFVFTTLWFLIFIIGKNKSSAWPVLDVIYHAIAVLFYLSASVLLALVTLNLKTTLDFLDVTVLPYYFKTYQEYISAVVFAFVTTLLYFIHAILSALRWKSS
ncbi:myelin and lymphocyte protein [Misgurnus anguillicaudatus]|uniref:myelin and lymphocyte protein n=1 Tax=Misgurnus anguillicaudatus TaxID=75329 RepID=UPI003CCF2FA6